MKRYEEEGRQGHVEEPSSTPKPVEANHQLRRSELIWAQFGQATNPERLFDLTSQSLDSRSRQVTKGFAANIGPGNAEQALALKHVTRNEEVTCPVPGPDSKGRTPSPQQGQSDLQKIE